MRKIISLVFILICFITISYAKPVLVVASLESNFYEDQWVNYFDEKVISSVNETSLFRIIYDPSISETMKYLLEKDSEYDYFSEYLKAYEADYLLLFSVNRLWNLEYSIQFQIIELKTLETVFLDIYTVDRENKIDESFEKFVNKLVENNQKHGSFRSTDEDLTAKKRGWGNIWTHLFSFILGIGITTGVIYLLSYFGYL